MAATKTKTIERVYNVPLRKEYRKVPRWKRTKKSVSALKQFLVKHMKSEEVKIDQSVNEKLWKNGIKNPPHHIKVTVSKDEKGIVKASLFGEKKKKAPQKKEKKKSKIEQIKKNLTKK